MSRYSRTARETLTGEIGETQTVFGRKYILLNPSPEVGPSTWRLSSIDEISDAGGGGGGSGVQDVSGAVPIKSTAQGPGLIDISIDISSLPEKS